MSDNPEKCANYLRIIRLIVDVGTATVRELFYFYKPKNKISEFFTSDTIYKKLSDLKRKHVITYEQFEKLTFEPNPEDLDISLLITVIVNLFKWTVEPPKNGWDKPLCDDDNSLGACLLRLKKLRNSLVGHSADARLSKDEFETFWEQAESLLTQIATYAGNKKKINEVIQSYWSSSLETDDKKDEKYIILLRKWHEEGVSALASLQQEVEELCKTTNEFGLFFKSSIPDRYKRYVLLLYEGGLLVLADALKRELRKDETDLKCVLTQNYDCIKLNCISGSLSSIYKDDTIETDVSKWGLKKLTDVILCLYAKRLTRMECRAISSIGKAYEDFAKTAMASLDSDKFRPYWTDIVSNINILSAALDDDTQMACQDLIKDHDTGSVDEATTSIYLQQMRQDCSPLQSLVQQYIEARDKLKHAVEQMQLEGACFGHDQVIELKMMTNGKTEEKRKLAENILHTVWEKAVSLSDDSKNFEVIEKSVVQILEGIKLLPGVRVSSVERHCIILVIECSCTTGLLGLLDFLESPSFMECTQSFSNTLSGYYEEEVIVTAFITVDSILQTKESLYVNHDEKIERCIDIKLSCSSIDAIRTLQQTVKSSETTNSINSIAQVLSEELEEKISIDTSLDIGGFDDEYHGKSFRTIRSSAWTQFILPGNEAYFFEKGRLPLHSRTSCLRRILAEIKVTDNTDRNALSHGQSLGYVTASAYDDEARNSSRQQKGDANPYAGCFGRRYGSFKDQFESYWKYASASNPYVSLSKYDNEARVLPRQLKGDENANVEMRRNGSLKDTVFLFSDSSISESKGNSFEEDYLVYLRRRKMRESRARLKSMGLDPCTRYFCSSPVDNVRTKSHKSTKSSTYREQTRLTRTWSSLPVLSQKNDYLNILIPTKKFVRSNSFEGVGRRYHVSHALPGYDWDSSTVESDFELYDNVDRLQSFCSWSSTEELQIISDQCNNSKSFEQILDFRRMSRPSLIKKSASQRDTLNNESPATELDSFSTSRFSIGRDLDSRNSFESFTSVASCDSIKSDISTRSMC